MMIVKINAHEARAMATDFNMKTKMDEWFIHDAVREITGQIQKHALVGQFKVYRDLDCLWNYDDSFTAAQKKHGIAEVKKILVAEGFKIKRAGFWSSAKISW